MIGVDPNSHVILPWDFSEHSKAAFNYALENVSPEKIRIICVLEKPNLFNPEVPWGDDAEDIARKKCEEHFSKTIDLRQYPGLQYKVAFGEPAEEIVRFVETFEQAVVIISTHGRSGVKRLLMGSVAQRVSQTSSSPVVLLPNPWFEATRSSNDSNKAIAES